MKKEIIGMNILFIIIIIGGIFETIAKDFSWWWMFLVVLIGILFNIAERLK